VTLDFLDDVLLLNLALKPAQCIFERLAFLNANLCQKIPPPNMPKGCYQDTGSAPFLRIIWDSTGIDAALLNSDGAGDARREEW
jgi:hypothetical protein